MALDISRFHWLNCLISVMRFTSFLCRVSPPIVRRRCGVVKSQDEIFSKNLPAVQRHACTRYNSSYLPSDERYFVQSARNSELYNEAVPIEFTRALLAQARAHNRDVQAILRAARFPFDPLRQDAQTVFVSREQYSRLCVELFRELGDESGGVMPDVQTPVGTTRLIALSMINSPNLVRRCAAVSNSMPAAACVTVPQIVNELIVDAEGKEATLTYLQR